MCGCDVWVVIVELFFSDAKVSNTVMIISVQQHVCALDVTVNDTHLRVQVDQTPSNVRQHKNPLVDRQRYQGTVVSARQTVLQDTTLHQDVDQASRHAVLPRS